MQHEKLSKTQDEKCRKCKMTRLQIALHHPVPLRWGLLAILLFAAFTVITQLQFNRINEEQIYRARVDNYLNEIRIYDAAVQGRELCLRDIRLKRVIENISGVTNVDLGTLVCPKIPPVVPTPPER